MGFHLQNRIIRMQSIVNRNMNVCSLYLHTSRLPVWVVDMNVIGPMCVVPHDCPLLAGVLVGLLHSVCVPVCPEDPILKQGNSKDVRKSAGNGPVSVLTVHVCKAEGGYSDGSVHIVGISVGLLSRGIQSQCLLTHSKKLRWESAKKILLVV